MEFDGGCLDARLRFLVFGGVFVASVFPLLVILWCFLFVVCVLVCVPWVVKERVDVCEGWCVGFRFVPWSEACFMCFVAGFVRDGKVKHVNVFFDGENRPWVLGSASFDCLPWLGILTGWFVLIVGWFVRVFCVGETFMSDDGK